MKERKYPIGEQNFPKIREGNYLYVDKTQYIPLLLDQSYYFLSRPRRFGKSLLLSTLESFFSGRRELFKGLAVEKFEWDWSAYPVIRMDLSEGSFSDPGGLRSRLTSLLDYKEKEFGLEKVYDQLSDRFTHLIKRLKDKTGKGVVILIDEYEKPLLDSFNTPFAEEYKNDLRNFYSVLKANTDSIRFLFITGVTRFGHLNIFSGLNNLNDISIDDRYAAICGITSEELIENFSFAIEEFAREEQTDFDGALKLLKDYYDGYHFSKSLIDIYNPFSLLKCLDVNELRSSWFLTGSSSYLLDRLRENHYDLTEFEGIKASANTLLGEDASINDPVTLLYQSGYLTIKDYDRQRKRYILGLPNEEVSIALYSAIIPYFLGKRVDPSDKVETFVDFLLKGLPEKAMNWLQSFFSSIPYDVKLDYERDFQFVIYGFFALAGLMSNAQLEKQTSNGRLDMVLSTDRYVYVFEFKLGNDAQKAMDQINSKQYSLQWQTDGRKVFKIGIAFSAESRGISDFIIEE